MSFRNDRPALIALTGLARAGKSTVAELLEREGYTRLRFATPLKEMLRAIGLTDREIEGDRKEVPCALLQGRTPRHAMQTLGTEWGRGLIGEKLWVDLWARKTTELLLQGQRVVVEDCRFEGEADAVRDLGGVVWRIERPGLTTGTHSSELGAASITADLVLPNTGTLERLADAVRLSLSPS